VTGPLAHLDFPPLLPLPLLVAVAAAAVLFPGWLAGRRGAGRRPPRSAVSRGRAVAALAAGGVLVAVAAGLGYGSPRLLALAFLALTGVSLELGPVWAAANPLRGLSGRLHRWAKAGAADHHGPHARLAGGVGVAALLALGWSQGSPLLLEAVGLAVLGYVVVQVLGGLVYGGGWFAAGDPVERYSRLSSGEVAAAGPVFLAALVAVPVHARLVHTEAWFDAIAGLRGGAVIVADLAGLVALLALVAGLLAMAPGGVGDAVAPAAVAFFAAHQMALLIIPPVPALGLDPAVTSPLEPGLVAATALPLSVLLGGHGYAVHRLYAGTRDLPERQAQAVRIPLQALIGVLAVAGVLLMARPL
jgi:hypothetical protein